MLVPVLLDPFSDGLGHPVIRFGDLLDGPVLLHDLEHHLSLELGAPFRS